MSVRIYKRPQSRQHKKPCSSLEKCFLSIRKSQQIGWPWNCSDASQGRFSPFCAVSQWNCWQQLGWCRTSDSGSSEQESRTFQESQSCPRVLLNPQHATDLLSPLYLLVNWPQKNFLGSSGHTLTGPRLVEDIRIFAAGK